MAERLQTAKLDEGWIARVLGLGHLGVAVFDERKRITWAAGELPGVDGDAALGLSCERLFAATDVPCDPCVLDLAVDEGPQRRIANVVSPAGTGTSRVFEIVASADQDDPRSWTVLACEVTGREGLESLLEATVHDVVQLIDAWSIPVVVLDGGDVVRSWNLGARKLYRHEASHALGANWSELVGEEASIDLSHVPSTRTRRYEATHRRADGTSFDVIVTR